MKNKIGFHICPRCSAWYIFVRRDVCTKCSYKVYPDRMYNKCSFKTEKYLLYIYKSRPRTSIYNRDTGKLLCKIDISFPPKTTDEDIDKLLILC